MILKGKVDAVIGGIIVIDIDGKSMEMDEQFKINTKKYKKGDSVKIYAQIVLIEKEDKK